jgi:hypothetical protein
MVGRPYAYAKMLPVPAHLGGLGDYWSSKSPKDEDAQGNKAVAPQRDHANSREDQ